jgi:hypothetical protein
LLFHRFYYCLANVIIKNGKLGRWPWFFALVAFVWCWLVDVYAFAGCTGVRLQNVSGFA